MIKSTKQSSINFRQAQNTLFSMMLHFRQNITAVNFVLSNISLDVPTEFISSGTPKRKQASTAPRGFGIIDSWIDFCDAIDSGNYREVIGLYYRLKRFINI